MTTTYRLVTLLASGLLLSFANGSAQGQTNLSVNTGDTQVQISEDGSVRVNTGATRVTTDGAGTVQTQGAGGKLVEFDGADRNIKHTCDAEHGQNVSVSGADNKVLLKGQCQNITVTGSGNIVTAETVGSITLQGVGNKVSYKQGMNGKAPKLDRSGVDNEVNQIKE